VALYGPPAAGKDTVTHALSRIDPSFVLFRRLMVGPGRTTGFRVTDEATVDRMRHDGEIVHENRRYGALFVTDRTALDRLVAVGRVPVVHIGQIDAVAALARYPARWTPILLWCSRPVTALRSRARGDLDTEARLRAWAETLEDLRAHPSMRWSAALRTDRVPPEEAATTIRTAVREHRPADRSSAVALRPTD